MARIRLLLKNDYHSYTICSALVDLHYHTCRLHNRFQYRQRYYIGPCARFRPRRRPMPGWSKKTDAYHAYMSREAERRGLAEITSEDNE